MNKYIGSDIRDGYTSLKIGLNNAIYALLNEEADKLQLQFTINYIVVSAVLKELFPDAEIKHSDSTIVFKRTKTISIKFNKETVTFNRI